MKEIWKDVKGYKGKYQVSNLGKIKVTKTGMKRKNGIPQMTLGRWCRGEVVREKRWKYK